jgi:formyltetrahydrofolate-dependent phosphoribosylglycinamide formyltransferase
VTAAPDGEPLRLPLAAAAFASGSGSNFVALHAAEARGAPWRIRLLVSDREDAGALERARAAGIATRVIPVSGRDPEAVGQETVALLQEHGIQVIFLAGYLRLVPRAVTEAYRKRILNVHPALLPAFGGKGMYGRRVHEAVLAAGERFSGPTVHFVDEHYDEGTILAQWRVPVLPDDTPETLAARVLEVEHRLYPIAAARLCRALASGVDPSPLAPARAQDAARAPELPSIETLFQEAFPGP